MSIAVEDLRSLSSQSHSIRYFQKYFQSINAIQKMKKDLMIGVGQVNSNIETSKASQWLFNLKIKHQVLLLTSMILIVVTAMSIGINHIQMKILTTIISNGFELILDQSNARFQASVIIKYMSLTQTFFENDQQTLIAINQIYRYGLRSQYQTDLGVECPILPQQPSYLKIDLFCYVPHASQDLQTFKNSTLNTEFIKVTNILNQFILCFGFQQSFTIKNVLQLNLDNQEQLSSYYPQSSPFQGYLPKLRPFFISQKQQYLANVTKRFYVSNYQKFYTNSGATSYGQTLTLSLLNGTEFQGIVAVAVSFAVFNQLLMKFHDVNLALVADDGTLLFEQNNLRKYDHQQFIYNQSYTGFNYIDWTQFAAQRDSNQQLVVNNTLFSQPLKVNIRKFKDLPYYFIVYNNQTYENQIKTIQLEILDNIDIKYKRGLFLFIVSLFVILIAVYYSIQLILKPLVIIQQIIFCYNENFQEFKQLGKMKLSKITIENIKKSNNILHILQLLILLKNSEFQNVGLIKNKICKTLEKFKFPANNCQNIGYIRQEFLQITDDADISMVEEYRSAQFVGYGFMTLDQIIEQDNSQTSLKCIKL